MTFRCTPLKVGAFEWGKFALNSHGAEATLLCAYCWIMGHARAGERWCTYFLLLLMASIANLRNPCVGLYDDDNVNLERGAGGSFPLKILISKRGLVKDFHVFYLLLLLRRFFFIIFHYYVVEITESITKIPSIFEPNWSLIFYAK